ncbi:hypothetical protein GOV05_02665 [Candidatus Woesearchaeota archaeon]|nr:hypothetical protein [Candidatus Woesearchaeota archaeon]
MKTNKKPAHKKIMKKKKVDYISLSILVLIIITLTFLGFNPDIITEIRNNETKFFEKEEVPDQYAYNGFEFTKTDGIWYTQIEKDGVPFVIMTQYSPKEVEDTKITYQENLFPSLTHRGDEVYLSFDPREENKSDVTVAAVDFAKGLSIVFGLRVNSACTVNETGCQEVLSCDSRNDTAIIELIRDEIPRAEYQGNCLKVYGTGQDLIRVVNRLMFEWYDIIKVDEAGKIYYP